VSPRSSPVVSTLPLRRSPKSSPSRLAALLPVELLVTMPYRRAVNLVRDRVSRDYLVALMLEFRGNVTHAAERAGMMRESLHRLLKHYRVRAGVFKGGKMRAGER
jgi:transcriptional regulator of acetoin/glycerol metabolism